MFEIVRPRRIFRYPRPRGHGVYRQYVPPFDPYPVIEVVTPPVGPYRAVLSQGKRSVVGYGKDAAQALSAVALVNSLESKPMRGVGIQTQLQRWVGGAWQNV